MLCTILSALEIRNDNVAFISSPFPVKDRATHALLALVHQNPNLTRLEVAALVPETIFVKLVIIQLSRLQPRRDASTYKCIQASSQESVILNQIYSHGTRK